MSRYYCFGTIQLSTLTDRVGASSTFYIDGVGTVPASFDTTTLPNGEYTIRAVSQKNEYNNTATLPLDNRLMVKFDVTDTNLIPCGRSDGYYFRKPLTSNVTLDNGICTFNGTEFIYNNYAPADCYLKDEFTITLSVNPVSVTTENTFGLKSVVFYKGAEGATTINYGIQLLNSTAIQFFTRIDGSPIAFYGFNVPNMLGTWTHLALVVKGTTLKLYINGVFSGSQGLTGYVSATTGLTEYISTHENTTAFIVGGLQQYEPSNYFIGSVRNIGIYGRELSQNEIVASMNEFKEWNSMKKIYIENINGHNTTGGTPPVLRGMNIIQSHTFSDANRVKLAGYGTKLVRVQLDAIRQANMTFEQSWPLTLAYALNEVQKCQELGMKCIIDVHSSPMITWTESGRVKSEWDDPLFLSRMTTIYTDICNTFLPYADSVYAYELFNEPQEPIFGYWRKFAVQFIEIVRAIDPDVWLIYDNAPSAAYRSFEGLEPLQDKRIIYTLHCYIPNEFCFQGLGRPTPVDYPSIVDTINFNKTHIYDALDSVKAFETTYNVPILVGEFSIVRFAPHDSSIRWFTDVLDYFENAGWGYTYHAYTPEVDPWISIYAQPLFELTYDETAPPDDPILLTSEAEQLTLIKSYFSRGL